MTTEKMDSPYHDVTAESHHSMDPALNPANQHHHAPRFHEPQAAHDDAVYTTGTTIEKSMIPTQVHGGSLDKTGHEVIENGSSSDHEKIAGGRTVDEESQGRGDSRSFSSGFGRFWKRWGGHILKIGTAMLFTGWWIASLILHRHDKNWIIPFLVWLCIMLRIFFWYVPSRYLGNFIKGTWKHTAVRVYNFIPARFRTLAGATGATAVILVASFVSEEDAENTRVNRVVSLAGLLWFLAMFYITSRDRRRINWRTVIGGMLAQYIIGLFVLRTGVGYSIFKFIADRAGDLLGFSKDGVEFLTDEKTANLPWFFIGVIPAIIFFISLVQVLYYIGFLQWFIKKFATFVFWLLGVSGAEAVVAAATPFIGQGESAMLVRPFVPHMTKAEIHQIMTCGFATISGSVLVGYIGLGLNAEALVSSCIMSIPASLAISKMRYPETEETLTAGRVVIPDDDEHQAENFLHAFANGTWLGIKIGGAIVASLLCILAAVGLVNGLLSWWGHYININHPALTLQTILSYVFYPVAFALGVPRQNFVLPLSVDPSGQEHQEILAVAKLIAQKVITNEYNAFNDLAHDPFYSMLSARSQLIATYALCGFGNIGSLGIQIGIFTQLAPSRGGDVSRLAFSALVSGVFATLTSATVAGLVVTDQLSHFVKTPS